MGIIEDIESQNKVLADASRTLTQFLTVAKTAVWKSFDADNTKAIAIYEDLKAKIVEAANALPEVTV